jgi:hypothetical protein
MHGLALVVALAFMADPGELPGVVCTINVRSFAIPVEILPDQQRDIKNVRLFVSTDQGRTWKQNQDIKPSDRSVKFTAPRDGQYWFALQTKLKSGVTFPPDRTALLPLLKVQVNTEAPEVLKVMPSEDLRTEGRLVQIPKPSEDLQREVEELRKTVEQLQLQIEVEQLRNTIDELQKQLEEMREKRKQK